MAKEAVQKIYYLKHVFEENYFWGLIAFFLLSFCIWLIFLVFLNSDIGFYFLPVGQGDAELIITENGSRILVDGGPFNTSLVNSLDKIIPFFDKYIDIVILTHPQLDHFGGMFYLFDNYKVGVFIDNGERSNTESYLRFEKLLREKQIKRLSLKGGDNILDGGDMIKFLYPFDFLRKKDLNDTALVFISFVRGSSAIFTSDISTDIENKILEQLFPVDILKVAHHGSKNSYNEKFFQKLSPIFSVIEVGKNYYGHPSSKVIDFLKSINSIVFRTDRDGLLRIYKENNNLIVKKL
jgi:competence protein ComEC